MEFTVMIYQTLMRRKIIFRHTATILLMNRITIRRMELFKIVNGKLSQMI